MFKHVLQGECSGLYNILETDSLIEVLFSVLPCAWDPLD